MSSSSSTSRNQLQVTHVQSQEGVKVCDCVVPAKERTCWKITNPGRRVLQKPAIVFEAETGCQKLSEMNSLRRRTAEVEFLLSHEQYKVAKSEKEDHDARKAIGRLKVSNDGHFVCIEAAFSYKLGLSRPGN
uniref:Uncharacterized protein n=1 Tax=Lactuca sativa TaxID=4236 RepID=A0A9R1WX82_LACSA|nr:hypothetical protein LSAT_V11C800415210 [Lactuca sativa]